MSPPWDPVRVYTLNQTVHWSIIGFILPVMVLLQLEKGLNLLEVGSVIAVYSATIILFELPTGGLSDTLGRKRVYLISLVMLFLSGTTVLLASDIVGMATGFFLFGLGRALSSGTMDAWFVDEFDRAHPGGNLQEALARANRLIPLGIGTTSLLAGVVPMTLGRITEGIPGLTVYSGNLILLNLVVVFQFLLTRRIVVEHLPTGRGSVLSGFKGLPEVLSTSLMYGVRNRVILVMMIATAIAGFGVSSVELLWQPRVDSLLGGGGNTWVFGVLAAAYFFSGSASNLLISPLCRSLRDNYPLVLFLVRVGVAIALVVLALQGAVLWFALTFVAFFLVYGMEYSPTASIINREIPMGKRSTLLSFGSLVLQVGVLVGAIVAGAISEATSIQDAWFLSAVLMGSSALLFLLLPLVSGGRIFETPINQDSSAPDDQHGSGG